MAGNLLLTLDDDMQQLAWLHTGADGKVLSSLEGSVEEASKQATGCKVVALVPTASINLTRADVPSARHQQLVQAIPFALEDSLAVDIEACHFAIGDRGQNKMAGVPVAVVGHEQMAAWVDGLAAVGVHPESLLPDVLAVPQFGDNSWSVLRSGEQAIVRSGEQSGFGVELENLEAMLNMALNHTGEKPPTTIHFIDCQVKLELPRLDRSGDTKLVQEVVSKPLIEVLKTGLAPSTEFNLLQGEYSRSEQLGKLLRPWFPAAIMLAVWVCIQVGFTWVTANQLATQNAQLSAQRNALFNAILPGERYSTDLKKQIENKLQSLRSGQVQGEAGFLQLLGKSAAPLGSQPSIELKRLSYRNHKLDVVLSIDDLQALDRLTTDLIEQTGFEVKVRSATSRDNHVEGRLAIKDAS